MIRLASYLVALAAWLLATPSGAAITQIQASTQGSCSSASSCATSFGSLPTVGNAVVVTSACWNGTATCSITSFIDNQTGNTYTPFCKQDPAGKSQACIAVVSSIRAPSGTFTVTANAATATSFEVIAAEYNSMLVYGMNDASASSTSATGTADTTASGATTQNDELSVCVMSQSGSSASLGITTPTGYTQRGIQNNANATVGFQSSDKILTTTGTQQCQWTHSTTGQAGWAAQLVTFKAGTVMSGCLLMQDGTSKYARQDASGGYLQQGGGTCNITPPASTIPFRTLIGTGT